MYLHKIKSQGEFNEILKLLDIIILDTFTVYSED